MTLKEFLVRVSIDPDRMARFVADPNTELCSSGVAECDRLLLEAGDAAALQTTLLTDHENSA